MPELFDFEHMPLVDTSLIEEGIRNFEEGIQLHDNRRTIMCGFGSGFFASFAISVIVEGSRVIWENGDPRAAVGITALALCGTLVSFGLSGRETIKAAEDFKRAEELRKYLAWQPIENLYFLNSENGSE